MVDAYSYWLEVIPMPSMTSVKTKEVFRFFFARYVLPEKGVSHNQRQIAQEEFDQLIRQNGIKFTRVPPYDILILYHSTANTVHTLSVLQYCT